MIAISNIQWYITQLTDFSLKIPNILSQIKACFGHISLIKVGQVWNLTLAWTLIKLLRTLYPPLHALIVVSTNRLGVFETLFYPNLLGWIFPKKTCEIWIFLLFWHYYLPLRPPHTILCLGWFFVILILGRFGPQGAVHYTLLFFKENCIEKSYRTHLKVIGHWKSINESWKFFYGSHFEQIGGLV